MTISYSQQRQIPHSPLILLKILLFKVNPFHLSLRLVFGQQANVPFHVNCTETGMAMWSL